MKQAVVLFPGVRYSCDAPLLYFARIVFGQRGFEVHEIDYGDQLQSTRDLEQAAKHAQADILSQIQGMKLEDCDDVVFVSKSIGTVLAGWVATQLPYQVRQIFLTPLAQTLPLMDPKRDRALGAGDDPYLAPESLVSYCREKQIPLTVYPGVGHRLEDKTQVHRTLQILTEIVELYETF